MEECHFETHYDALRNDHLGAPSEELVTAAQTVVEVYSSTDELTYDEARRLIDAGGIILHEECDQYRYGQLTFDRLVDYAGDRIQEPNSAVKQLQPSDWIGLDIDSDEFEEYFEALFGDESTIQREYHRDVIGYALPCLRDEYDFTERE